MMLIIASLAMGLGFIAWKVRERGVIVEPAPLPRWANPDHEIYDIVLSDLIDEPSFNYSIDLAGPSRIRSS